MMVLSPEHSQHEGDWVDGVKSGVGKQTSPKNSKETTSGSGLILEKII